jgi:hypothetical protein
MKKIVIVILGLGLLVTASFALQPEIIGGVRDGLAVGVMIDHQLGKNYGMRIGIEGNTGHQPLILFLGGKFYLGNLAYNTPFSLGLAGVGYMGSGSSNALGFGISGIINNAFGIKPMFVEFGVDVVGSARGLLQVGYKLY